MMEDEGVLTKTKRKQVGRACANCRKSKTACSETRPCTRCINHKITETCTDAPRKRRIKVKEEDNSINGNVKPRRTKKNTSPIPLEGMEIDLQPKSDPFTHPNYVEEDDFMDEDMMDTKEEDTPHPTLFFDIPYISDSTSFLLEGNSNNNNNNMSNNNNSNNNSNNSGGNNNNTVGSSGSLSDLLEGRNTTPSLETLIVNVVGDIKKKKDSFVNNPIPA